MRTLFFYFRVPLSLFSSLSRPLSYTHTYTSISFFMDERAMHVIVGKHMAIPVGIAHIGQAIA